MRSHLKYGNKKTKLEGITFDSRKEAHRYSELRMMEKAGLISGLTLQPSFEICPKVGTYRARVYRADFQYYDENGQLTVEDVKSEITRKNLVYTLKRQLFLDQYGEKYRFIET